MNKKVTLFLLIFILFQSVLTQGQNILENLDFNALKIDNLSDEDIDKVGLQLKSNNSTIEEFLPIALSRGMTTEEFMKLKNRLISSNIQINKPSEPNLARRQMTVENIKVKDEINPLVFGSELFDNPTLNFEPNLTMASPMNYILGPGDELQVAVYGVQEYNATITVNVEGKVSIKNVGQFSISDLSFEAGSQKIKNAIAKVYSTVASGQSQVEVILSKIRTIKITLIGSKQPGNYSISSLGTVYNALFLGGGPAKNETYRNIELIRNNKVVRTIDIYNFLISGSKKIM